MIQRKKTGRQMGPASAFVAEVDSSLQRIADQVVGHKHNDSRTNIQTCKVGRLVLVQEGLDDLGEEHR